MTNLSGLSKRHTIKRQSLPDALTESLRERILNGEFQPGEALVQEALAEEYECSRMPVREAFRQLEAAGLIVTKINKGAVVAALHPDNAMELYELRAQLECSMLALSIPKMTDEDLQVPEQVLAELKRTYEERDMARWGSLNWEFHQSLYAPANRVQTTSIIAGIHVQLERYIRLELLISESFQKANEEHSQLLQLCYERNVEKAALLLERHIIEAGTSLVSSLLEKRRIVQRTTE